MIKDLRFADYFLFTQHSLATFYSCPLKFKKRYLDNLKWGGFSDEDMKKRVKLGNDFHLMARRFFLGVDTGTAECAGEKGELGRWFENLKNRFRIDPDAVYLPEYKLRMVSSSLRLEANFDLLVIREDSAEIWDWKTHSRDVANKGDRESRILKKSLQTEVYMYVLKEQSALAAGRELECEKISMYYWQPDPPQILAEIRYDPRMHAGFRDSLESKVREILAYDYSGFDRGRYGKHCKYCEFNRFCNNERVDFKAIGENDFRRCKAYRESQVS